MTQEEARKMIIWCINEAIRTGDYNMIRINAEQIAYSYGIQMAFDDEYVAVEDEVFYFNGAF